MLDFLKNLFSSNSNAFTNMEDDEFEQGIRNTKKSMILDVRHRHEFTQEKIPNAVNMDVRMPNFKEKIANYDKRKTYFVYCQSGRRSAKACKTMASLGFENIVNLKGGLNQYNGRTV